MDIYDVSVNKLNKFSDDRGFFMEIFRESTSFLNVKQTSFTKTYPGIIKAFHWHKFQWDSWFVASGMAQVVLYDLREESPTYRQFQTIYAGEDNPVLINIPPHVAHGYKVLGNTPVTLFYNVTQEYNNITPDEERIPFDSLEYDWTTKNR